MTTESPKFMPGPWRRDGSQVAPAPGVVLNAMNHTVYVVGGEDGAHPTLFISSYVATKREREQFEANVALCIEAPNLYAACEALLQMVELWRWDHDHDANEIAAARKALGKAKAKGGME